MSRQIIIKESEYKQLKRKALRYNDINEEELKLLRRIAGALAKKLHKPDWDIIQSWAKEVGLAVGVMDDGMHPAIMVIKKLKS